MGNTSGGKKMADKPKHLNATQLAQRIAQDCSVSVKVAKSMITCLGSVVIQHLSKNGPGVFVYPGIMKIIAVTKPATPERNAINPFTRQPMVVPAKRESKKVKFKALKSLKAAVLEDKTTK